MNKVFEKILEFIDEQIKIEESIAKSENEGHPITHQYGANCMNVIKKFVQEVAEEFATDTNVGTNGWIPCSEKLPELRQDVLVTVKYTGFMGMHGYWIKTGHMEAENDWWGDCAGGEVIAWMELPSAYRPKEK